MWEEMKKQRERVARETPSRELHEPPAFRNLPSTKLGSHVGDLLQELAVHLYACTDATPHDITNACRSITGFWEKQRRRSREELLDLLNVDDLRGCSRFPFQGEQVPGNSGADEQTVGAETAEDRGEAEQNKGEDEDETEVPAKEPIDLFSGIS